VRVRLEASPIAVKRLLLVRKGLLGWEALVSGKMLVGGKRLVLALRRGRLPGVQRFLRMPLLGNLMMERSFRLALRSLALRSLSLTLTRACEQRLFRQSLLCEQRRFRRAILGERRVIHDAVIDLLRSAANRAQSLALEALDFGRIGAAPALQVQVLLDCVIE
jgi:hypothetical protein